MNQLKPIRKFTRDDLKKAMEMMEANHISKPYICFMSQSVALKSRIITKGRIRGQRYNKSGKNKIYIVRWHGETFRIIPDNWTTQFRNQ